MAESLSRHERTRCYRRSWAFERIGWAVMAVIVCCAAAGVFGNGPLSRAESAAGDALAAHYPRFARAHAPLEVDVEWAAHEGEAELWISRRYLDQFAVEEVRPPPAAVTLRGERLYYTFRLSPASERARVSFRLRPERAGRLSGALGVDAPAQLELSQWILP